MLECDVPWTWESRGGASGSICCCENWVITAGLEDCEMLERDVPWTWESRGGASGSICCSVSWIITAGIEGNVEEWDGEEGPASTKGGMVNMENGLADER